MRSLAVIPVLLLAFAACGNDDDGDGSSGGSTPKCSDIWTEGATIPKGYEGCVDGSTLNPVAIYDDCAGGKVFMRDDRMYGFEGEGVHVVPEGTEIGYDLPEYDQLWRECYPTDDESSS